MTLAIITAVYQNYTVLKDFFGSLMNQTSKDFRVYIVDVSKDRQEIEKVNLPVSLVSAENKGYAAAVNEGVRKAISDGITEFAVVNSDIIFDKDFVANATASIRKNPKSVIGGKIYYAPGYEYHKNRYTKDDLGKVIWYAGGEIDWNHVQAAHRGVDAVDKGQYDEFTETGFVTGCLTCFDRDLWRAVGEWDQSYFMYYEDTDFSVRASRLGLKNYYDPSIIIWHKNAQSTEGAGSSFHVQYQNRNRIKFGMKYAPFRTKIHLVIEKLKG